MKTDENLLLTLFFLFVATMVVDHLTENDDISDHKPDTQNLLAKKKKNHQSSTVEQSCDGLPEDNIFAFDTCSCSNNSTAPLPLNAD